MIKFEGCNFPRKTVTQAPSGPHYGEICKRHFYSDVFFPSTLLRRNLKTQQLPIILDLCLRKPRAGKSRDYRDVIVFEKLRFQNVFRSVLSKTQSRRFQIRPV